MKIFKLEVVSVSASRRITKWTMWICCGEYCYYYYINMCTYYGSSLQIHNSLLEQLATFDEHLQHPLSINRNTSQLG